MMKGISYVHACTCIFLSSNQTDRGATPKQWQVTNQVSTFHFAAPEEVSGPAAWPNPSAVSVLPGHKGTLSSSTLNRVCISLVCLLSSALLRSARRSLLPQIKEEEWDWSLQHTFSLKKYSSPAIVNVLKSSRCDFYICTNLWHYFSSMYLACQLIVSVFLPSCCAHSFEGFKMLLQKYSSLSSQYFPQRKPSKLFPSQAYFLIQIIAVHWTLSCWGQSWILRSTALTPWEDPCEAFSIN